MDVLAATAIVSEGTFFSSFHFDTATDVGGQVVAFGQWGGSWHGRATKTITGLVGVMPVSNSWHKKLAGVAVLCSRSRMVRLVC
jgi:hypothetical protein